MNALAGTGAQRGGMVLGVIFGLLIGLGIALGVAMYIAKVPVPFMDKTGGHRTPEQEAADAERLRNWDPNAGLAGRTARPVFEAASNAASATAAAASGASAVAQAASAASAPAPVVVVQPVPPRRSASAPVALASAPRSTRDPAAILSGREPGSPGSSGSTVQAILPPPAASRVTEAKEARPAAVQGFQVQAGAYSSATEAEQQRARLALQGYSARLHEREINGRMVYRVRIGPFDTRNEADKLREQLQSAGVDAILIPAPHPAQ